LTDKTNFIEFRKHSGMVNTKFKLLHVSIQTPSSGSVLFEFVKVTVIKIIR